MFLPLRLDRSVNVRQILILLAVFLGLVVYWSRSVTEAPITGDALHNLRMGARLAHHGVIAGHWSEEIKPTMYREPLPAFSNAAGVAAVDAFIGEENWEAYTTGPRAKYLKYQNLLWATTMTIAVFGLLWILTSSFPVALFGALIANLPVPAINRPDIDTLLTEPMASSSLAVTALFLAWWAHRESRILLLFAGLAFGLLTLTKAVFLYVFIGMLLVLPLVQIIFGAALATQSDRRTFRKVIADLSVFAAAFALITLPWMLRNYMHFDTFKISERSGVILMQRAVMNRLTNEEYLGALYLFAPNKPLKSAVSALTGFGPDDLKEGGRLQHLNHGKGSGFSEEDLAAEREGRPEDAISYHRRARAWRTKLANEYEAAGYDRPRSVADVELQKRAIDQILEEPLQHLAFTPLAVWRGALASSGIFLIGLIYALRSRRKDVALTVLPSIGMIAIYALATPFESRMGTTVMPLSVAVALVLVVEGWRRLRSNLHQIPQPNVD